MKARGLLGIALALSACFGSASSANDCGSVSGATCTGTCGDGTGPGCDPRSSHIDYTLTCVPTVGASGRLGDVCCMPGASDASADGGLEDSGEQSDAAGAGGAG